MDKNSKLSLFALGVGLGTGLLALFFWKKNSKRLEKDVAIKILTELEQETTTVLRKITIETLVQYFKDVKFNDKDVAKYGLMELDKAHNVIYKKYDVTNEEFYFALENSLKADIDIKVKDQNYGNAVTENLSELILRVMEVPEFMTPEFTLSVLAQILKSTLKTIHKGLLEYYQREGQVGFKDNKELELYVGSLNVQGPRDEILKESGLKEDITVFFKLVSKYAMENEDFAKRSFEMQRLKEEIVDGLFEQFYLEETELQLESFDKIANTVS